MGKHADKAVENFKQGYNCAQAVFVAFAEEMGMDEKTAAMLSSSFGGGMGRMREVCGAVSGMFMAAGLKYGYSDPESMEDKMGHYKLIQDMAKRFKESNGTIICRELLGEGPQGYTPEKRTEAYYKKRPCVELVRDAAEIFEKILEEKG